MDAPWRRWCLKQQVHQRCIGWELDAEREITNWLLATDDYGRDFVGGYLASVQTVITFLASSASL